MAGQTSKAAEKKPTGPDTPPEAETLQEEPRFDRARVLDPSEGPRIVGHVEQLGRAATYPEIVGALDGDDSETFTPGEVAAKVIEFRGHPTEQAA